MDSGSTIRVPCYGGRLSGHELQFKITNCGSVDVCRGATGVVQSGRRTQSGRLGLVDFSEGIVTTISYSASADCSSPGVSRGERCGCKIISIPFSRLTIVDSTLTFTGSSLEEPYIIHLNFGDYSEMSGTCSY